MFLWLLLGGFPTCMLLKSHIFNLFLLSFPKGENIGCKAAVNILTYFSCIILLPIIHQHSLNVYLSVSGKSDPSFLLRCGAAGCAEPWKMPPPGPRGLRGCGASESTRQMRPWPLCFALTRGLSGIPLGKWVIAFGWDSQELGFTPPTPKRCSRSFRAFQKTCNTRNLIIQQGFSHFIRLTFQKYANA